MDIQYQICSKCIMDTSDPNISFNEKGVCNHCLKRDAILSIRQYQGKKGELELDRIVNQIKTDQKGNQYDCVIGISGGVDSSYVAYQVKKLGLRPLAVHMDNGWNSELAVSNIEKLLKKLDIDLYTCVLDWNEFKSLQLAFLRASVPDLEIPTDHSIWAVLYNIAAKKKIKYIISGMNVATETHLPSAWSHGHHDWRYIRGLNKLYGDRKLSDFPHISIIDKVKYKFINNIKRIDILDYMDYNKKKAMETLQHELEWRYYGGKHYESIYTRFIQGYILPKKFNYDKRRVHISSLICAGEISREKALEEIANDPYNNQLLNEDREFVIKKLGLTTEQFNELMSLPNKSFYDYDSYEKSSLYNYLLNLYRKTFNK